jgi:hypothetical protein
MLLECTQRPLKYSVKIAILIAQMLTSHNVLALAKRHEIGIDGRSSEAQHFDGFRQLKIVPSEICMS